MLQIRLARRDEFPRVVGFYEDWDYRGEVTEDASVFLAELHGQLVGLVRLEPEFGTVVLRGMRVQPPHQRQGVGTALLQAVAEASRNQTLYCVPIRTLKPFTVGSVSLKWRSPLRRNFCAVESSSIVLVAST